MPVPVKSGAWPGASVFKPTPDCALVLPARQAQTAAAAGLLHGLLRGPASSAGASSTGRWPGFRAGPLEHRAACAVSHVCLVNVREEPLGSLQPAKPGRRASSFSELSSTMFRFLLLVVYFNNGRRQAGCSFSDVAM